MFSYNQELGPGLSSGMQVLSLRNPAVQTHGQHQRLLGAAAPTVRKPGTDRGQYSRWLQWVSRRHFLHSSRRSLWEKKSLMGFFPEGVAGLEVLISPHLVCPAGEWVVVALAMAPSYLCHVQGACTLIRDRSGKVVGGVWLL